MALVKISVAISSNAGKGWGQSKQVRELISEAHGLLERESGFSASALKVESKASRYYGATTQTLTFKLEKGGL